MITVVLEDCLDLHRYREKNFFIIGTAIPAKFSAKHTRIVSPPITIAAVVLWISFCPRRLGEVTSSSCLSFSSNHVWGSNYPSCIANLQVGLSPPVDFGNYWTLMDLISQFICRGSKMAAKVFDHLGFVCGGRYPRFGTSSPELTQARNSL